MPAGTLSITDLLNETSGNVVDFGENRVWEAFATALMAHNRIVEENLMEFVEYTTDSLRGTAGYDRMEMEELDEFGVPGPQKVTAGANLGFPLRFMGIAVQWTRLFLRKTSPAALAAQFNARREADVRAVLSALRRALYSPTNYSFVDRRVKQQPTLPVKALANADGFFIPLGPNGEEFTAGSHTHYLASATLTTTALDSLIDTVREHFDSGDIRLVINKAQETTVRGLTGFVAYPDPRIVPAITATTARQTLDVNNTYNRAIGVYGGCEVWVKPWAIAGYVLAYRRMGGMNGRKILAYRRPMEGGTGDLEMLFQDESYPLRADAMGREFGIGVQDRVGAAVLMVGDTTYAAPATF